MPTLHLSRAAFDAGDGALAAEEDECVDDLRADGGAGDGDADGLGELAVIQRGSRRYVRQEDLQKMLENEAQISPESARPRPGRNGHRAKMNPADIDPRLREFFD